MLSDGVLISAQFIDCFHVRELSCDTFLCRNLQWLQKMTMALTTPSSQEAQSTCRTWSDHLYSCGVKGLGYHPHCRETAPKMIDFIKLLPQPRRPFGHVLRVVWGGGDWADDAPWERNEDSLLRILSLFYSLCTKIKAESTVLSEPPRVLHPLGVNDVCSTVPHCHSHAHTQCAVFAPVALWTHASRCARLHGQVTCFICWSSHFFCFVRFIFVLQQ